MIVDFIFGKAVLAVYTLICAYTDFKRKEINLGICIIMYISEILFYSALVLMNKEIDYMNILYGFISGCILLVISKVGKEVIGVGDGLFFIATGIAIGIKNNILVMMITLIFVGMFALFLYVASFIRGKYIIKQNLPLIPFVLPVVCYVYIMNIKLGAGI